jgi:hypothetical protein
MWWRKKPISKYYFSGIYHPREDVVDWHVSHMLVLLKGKTPANFFL